MIAIRTLIQSDKKILMCVFFLPGTILSTKDTKKLQYAKYLFS